MPPTLRAQLQEFTNAQDPEHLQKLDTAVCEASIRGLSQEDKEVLLQVFERFPEEDGFGIFWGILHALEGADGYDGLLIESVRRAPNLFNTLMVHRIINAGITSAEGTDLRGLLAEVLQSEGVALAVVAQVKSLLRHVRASEA